MSNSIWKTRDQKPKQEELAAWVDRNGMHAGRFDTCYNCFYAGADYRADLRKVKRWCSLENLDNLIAQADKAERLQKAVDLIANMEQRLCIDDPVDILDDVLKIAKDEIKQLIKENQ